MNNSALLLTGLANQARRQFSKKGIDSVFPDPFCGLTEEDNESPVIKEFARHFGKPELKTSLDEGQINRISVVREAPCGNTLYVAERLPGINTQDAVEKAGQLHRQTPLHGVHEHGP